MNRTWHVGAIALAGALAAPALAAPPAAQVTVDEVVCRYSADCVEQGDDAPTTTAPSRGFSFQPARKPTLTGQPQAEPAAAVVKQAERPRARPSVRPKPPMGVSRNDLLVSFENDSFQLTGQAKANISVFARALMSPQLLDKRFEIVGHTNAIGAREYNIELSQRRAEAVADYLEGQGISRSRLVLKGLGPDKPLPEVGATAPQNRRVEADMLPAS